MDQTDSVITNINQITRVNDEVITNRASKSARNPIRDNNALTNQSSSTTDNSPSLNKASKRPKNTALKQQRLPAWQPILTAKTVLPLFFSIGAIFVILGGVLLHYSNIVNEHVIDYTDCTSSDYPNVPCSKLANSSYTCYCNISFKLDKDFESPVYIYYGLKNFYQNHRRYVKSRDDNQLLGNAITSVNSECAPYDKSKNNSKIYAPCGAIANSLFNDSFSLQYQGSQNLSTPVKLNLLATGIAWYTDKTVKFKNPSSWDNTERPMNWQKDVWNLSTDPDNTGYKNEDLIVWMRTAALPTFRKFHRRVDHSVTQFNKNIPAGYYMLTINYNYPVTSFNGRKSFIISTTTWIGGKNPFLGIAYLVVGSLCIVLGVVFLIIHFKFAKNVKPPEELNNQNRANLSAVETINKN